LNNKSHHCTKYIDVKHYFIKEQTEQGNVTFKYISSADNLADIFTKPLPHETIQQLTSYLDMDSRPTSMVQEECYSIAVAYIGMK